MTTSEQCSSIGDKEWRHRVGKKLKFAFSKSRLAENLSTLTSLNDRFVRISDQIIRLKNRQPNQEKGSTRGMGNLDRDVESLAIESYRKVQRASRLVYDALGRACTKHTDHRAFFGIDAQLNADGVSAGQVTFHLSFSHFTLPSSGMGVLGEPLWFVIQSILKDAKTAGNRTVDVSLVEIANTLKRHGSGTTVPPSKRVKKVTFADCTSATVPILPPCQTSLYATVPDLLKNQNFCDRLRSFLQQPSLPSACVGKLEESETCRHLLIDVVTVNVLLSR